MSHNAPVSILLVDLAGIERNKNVFDEERLYQKQFNESKNINLSLSTLLRCFRALHNQEFLPYRESALTRFIFESFVKQVKIILLVAFDPWHVHFDDNIRVLEFSRMAKEIKLNSVKKNMTVQDIHQRQSVYEQSAVRFREKSFWYSPYSSYFQHKKIEGCKLGFSALETSLRKQTLIYNFDRINENSHFAVERESIVIMAQKEIIRISNQESKNDLAIKHWTAQYRKIGDLDQEYEFH